MTDYNGIHHIAMSVPSLEEARKFYIDLLGMKEVSTYSWENSPRMDAVTGLKDTAGEMMWVDAGNMLLELFEYRSPTPRAVRPEGVHNFGYTHFCLDIRDAAGLYEKLKATGMAIYSEPQHSANALKFYGKDPFGNVIEFQEVYPHATMPTRVPGTSGGVRA